MLLWIRSGERERTISHQALYRSFFFVVQSTRVYTKAIQREREREITHSLHQNNTEKSAKSCNSNR